MVQSPKKIEETTNPSKGVDPSQWNSLMYFSYNLRGKLPKAFEGEYMEYLYYNSFLNTSKYSDSKNHQYI